MTLQGFFKCGHDFNQGPSRIALEAVLRRVVEYLTLI